MLGKVSVDERLADVEKVVGALAESLSSLRHVVSCLADEVANQRDDRPTLPLNADEWLVSYVSIPPNTPPQTPDGQPGWWLIATHAVSAQQTEVAAAGVVRNMFSERITFIWARKRIGKAE